MNTITQDQYLVVKQRSKNILIKINLLNFNLQVVDSIESYYKENATEENREAIKKNINAIASIFGTDLTDRFAQWDSESDS